MFLTLNVLKFYTNYIMYHSLSLTQTPIPSTPDLDALSMLTDDAQIATWNNEGLPSDRMSTENATILCNCERWPLMIDPQLQVKPGNYFNFLQ